MIHLLGECGSHSRAHDGKGERRMWGEKDFIRSLRRTPWAEVKEIVGIFFCRAIPRAVESRSIIEHWRTALRFAYQEVDWRWRAGRKKNQAKEGDSFA